MNAIGIDLGTTNSVAATLKNGRYEYLKFNRDEELLPSVLLLKDNKLTIGSRAKKRAVIYAENYISSAKTYMGEIKPRWSIEGREFNPTDVATEVLREIYKAARKFFDNDEPIQAVITTPAYFSGSQNAETEKAGVAAGFIVKQILAEPVAAALAYAYGENKSNEKIYVVDLGGGTFDISIIENLGDNHFQTLMKGGDRKLGGDDFDAVLVGHMINHIRRDIGVDLSTVEKSGLDQASYSSARQNLQEKAEETKCVLSDAFTCEVNCLNLFPYKGKGYNLEMTITRDTFLECAEDLIKRIQKLIKNSFNDLEFGKEDIDKVILVGGSCKMPFVRDFVTDFFGKKPYDNKDLSKLVSMGATLLACDESTDGIKFKVDDIIAHSMGIEVVGDKLAILLPKKTVYPCKNTQIFTTVRDNQDSVDINVYEGEDEDDIANDQFYGGFTVNDIQIARAGVPEIEVTFEYDASCILHISARDLCTGASGSKEIKIEVGNAKKKPEEPKVSAYDIVVLLDNSGSMDSSMETAKNACRKLISDMIDMELHRVAFYTFESSIVKLSGLTHDKQKLLTSISGVRAMRSTNMAGAIDAAYSELYNQPGVPLVILVTDGYPDSKDATSSAGKRLKNMGVQLACIGVGSGVDTAYLKGLASSRDDYYGIRSMSGLEGIFKTITSGLRLK